MTDVYDTDGPPSNKYLNEECMKLSVEKKQTKGKDPKSVRCV